MRFTRKTLALLLAAALLARTAGAVAFTASLDRDALTLGESATLSLTFEGGQPGNVTLPPVDGLDIKQVGHSSQTTSDFSGHGTTVTTFLLAVTPQREGEFAIPAIRAEINGQPLASAPLKLTVGKPSAPTAEAVNSGNEIAFLKLNFSKAKMFTGESDVMHLDLYLRDEVQNFGNFQITSSATDGFSIGKMVELPSQRRRAQVGSRVFTVIPYTVPLTAVKTGTFPLGPFTVNLVVVVPGGPNGFFSEQKQVALATEAVNVETLPLPVENKPANFTGAIGDFTLAATAGPTAVTVGDPITVRATISGRGSLDALALPAQEAWRNFKTYPPTAKVETSDPFRFQGRKIFEQIVSPLNSDVHELPPLTFTFFNPADGQYHTLTQPATPLTVRAAGATPLPVVAANKNSANENQTPSDILPVKENLGALETKTIPLISQTAFVALQTLPMLAFLAAFIWRKRTDSLANNPRLRRQRAVTQLVAGGLTDLNKFAAENKSPEFFALLFRLLQEQLGERLDCPASAITEADVTRLAQLKANPETVKSLHELFQFCNQARYAPIQTRQELAAIAAKFKRVSGEVSEVRA